MDSRASRRGAAQREREPAAEGLDPLARDLRGRPENRVFHAGQFGLDQRRAAGLQFGDGDRRGAGGDRAAPIEQAPRHGERDDLHGGDDLAGTDDRMRRQRPDGDGLVEQVHPVDAFGVDAQHAGCQRVEVPAAGARRACLHVRADEERGQFGCGDVLGDVVRPQPGAGDGRETLVVEQIEVARRQHAALLQRPSAELQRVGEHHAFGGGQGKFVEDHRTLLRARRGPFRRDASGSKAASALNSAASPSRVRAGTGRAGVGASSPATGRSLIISSS
ncbi:hypothetical protein AzCIB_1796 [Azoarcus sp. CIB]|uniref:hypothetical protein n=1 Tax=Aromatoleum sp. (strain CIB) TaxID=198107 RepID=UPI00067DF576|nr:hypothetical protein [Azoarcus sp. CIB]AKU11691.1 hypothetical protein AzCIB_1796 [Azoarcus sp. CIB]